VVNLDGEGRKWSAAAMQQSKSRKFDEKDWGAHDVFCVCSDAVPWSAGAEIETFSRSTRMLPRSVYLSHQFNFFHLPSDDWSSHFSQGDFDVQLTKVDVRREVEITSSSLSSSAGAGAGTAGDSYNYSAEEAFGGSLSSAMHTMLDADPSAFSPGSPSYPNGVPGRHSSRWRDLRTGVVQVARAAEQRASAVMRRRAAAAAAAAGQPSSSLEEPRVLFGEDDEDDETADVAVLADVEEQLPSLGRDSSSTPFTSLSELDEGDDWDASWDAEGGGGETTETMNGGKSATTTTKTTTTTSPAAVNEEDDYEDFAVGLLDEQREQLSYRQRQQKQKQQQQEKEKDHHNHNHSHGHHHHHHHHHGQQHRGRSGTTTMKSTSVDGGENNVHGSGGQRGRSLGPTRSSAGGGGGSTRGGRGGSNDSDRSGSCSSTNSNGNSNSSRRGATPNSRKGVGAAAAGAKRGGHHHHNHAATVATAAAPSLSPVTGNMSSSASSP
jgi:hypothetical protein